MLIVENLRVENCEIMVDVGDTQNKGREAKLRFEIVIDEQGGIESKELSVKLYYPPHTERMPNTPRTGKVHTVRAILLMEGESCPPEEEHLHLCGA